jgi:fucose 4-O-acetylase-like acetyltransferase
MPNLALLVGVALIAVGLGGYVGTGAAHPTALIPAALGVLIAGAGLLARNDRLRMHAMHAAVLVALLGALACLFKLLGLLSGPTGRPVAMASQALTFIICTGFVVSAVRSFIEARRNRAGAS